MYPMSFMPDPGPLSEEDKEKLGALDRQIAIAEQQKLALIREISNLKTGNRLQKNPWARASMA